MLFRSADLQNIITSVEAIFTPNPVAGVGGGGIVVGGGAGTGGTGGVVDAGGVGAGGGGGVVAVPVDPTPIV